MTDAAMFSMRLTIGIAFLWLGAVEAQYGAMEMAAGLSPRFYLGNSPELARRQSGLCPSDEHSCTSPLHCTFQGGQLTVLTVQVSTSTQQSAVLTPSTA
jgi:hypothetical protein